MRQQILLKTYRELILIRSFGYRKWQKDPDLRIIVDASNG